MKFGATHMVNASDRDPVEQREGNHRRHAARTITFEVVGSRRQAIKAAYDMAGKSPAPCTLVGIAPFGAEAPLNAVDMVRNEKTVRGTYYGSTHAKRRYAQVRRAISGWASSTWTTWWCGATPSTKMNEAYDDMDKPARLAGASSSFSFYPCHLGELIRHLGQTGEVTVKVVETEEGVGGRHRRIRFRVFVGEQSVPAGR